MSYQDTKTKRTLMVSMLVGPKGQTLRAADYVTWLDREGWHGDEVEKLDEIPVADANATCVVCSKGFVATRSTAKYDTKACEARATRERGAKGKKTRTSIDYFKDISDGLAVPSTEELRNG